MGFAVFLILFVLIGSVSAADDNTTNLNQDTDNGINPDKISTENDNFSLKEIENEEILKTSVSGDTFTDIQTAIDSAESGDTIELNGIYKGSGKAITIDKILKSKKVVKVKKNAKKAVIKATLKSSKGKAIKNKRITFNVKGKTYKAKTNKKGIAEITLKIEPPHPKRGWGFLNFFHSIWLI